MKTRLAILLDARASIAAGWCQNTEAETEDGMMCEPGDSRAVRWCLFGALQRATGSAREAYSITESLTHWVPTFPIEGLPVRPVDYNDFPSTTQSDILGLFDKEIQHQLSLEVA